VVIIPLAACAADPANPGTRPPSSTNGSISAGTGASAGTETGSGTDNPGPASTTGTEAGAGGGTLIGGSSGSGAISDPDKCGEHHFDLERKPAKLLLVLDRSGSMKDAPSGASASTTKWDLVVPAVNQVITETDSAVSWGMKVFPEGSGSECDATGVTSNIDVPVAAMNASKVTAAVSAATPDGNGTPTGDAIDRGLTYLQSLKDTNPKYMLLATDGEPSCPKPSTTARTFAIESVAKAAATGIHTFVVGVSTTKSTATAALNDMAVAGMEPRADPNPLATKYYLANTKDELTSALKVITGQISGCVFNWNDAPPVPGNIAVKVGGLKAPRDANDGWEYTGTDYKGVEVHGAWCDMIKTTAANMVEIVFGCPDVEIF
jgi:Mg-chelatase subunit ChlD